LLPALQIPAAWLTGVATTRSGSTTLQFPDLRQGHAHACSAAIGVRCADHGWGSPHDSLNRNAMDCSAICGKAFHEGREHRPPKRSATAIGAFVLALATVRKLFGKLYLARHPWRESLTVCATAHCCVPVCGHPRHYPCVLHRPNSVTGSAGKLRSWSNSSEGDAAQHGHRLVTNGFVQKIFS
jgi:hypothetical protein